MNSAANYLADYLVFTLLEFVPGSRGGEALDFFIYDIVGYLFNSLL